MIDAGADALDDVLAELRAELTVEPSGSFAAGVRRRIGAQPARAWFTSWTMAGAALAVVAGVLIVRPWFGNGEDLARPAEVVAAASITPATPAAASASVRPVVEAGGGSDLARAQSRARVAGVSSAGVKVAAVASARRGPEVLVPADQRIALMSILAGLRSGHSEVPAPLATVVDSEGRMPAPGVLDIPMIVIELMGPVSEWRRQQ